MSDKENPFEKIRDRALAKKAAREKGQSQRIQDDIHAGRMPGVLPLFAARPELSEVDKPGSGQETKGLTVNAALAQTPTSQPERVLVDKTNWDRCGKPDDLRFFGTIANHPKGFETTRAWSATGQPLALYTSGDLVDIGGVVLEPQAFILADEPAAAWLRGDLPKEPVSIPIDGVAVWPLEQYPYSNVRNVLLACDLKGLKTGMAWAGELAQIQRFGGMPVIAFHKDNLEALAAVDWRRATVRASGKTWDLCKAALPVDVLRLGLR